MWSQGLGLGLTKGDTRDVELAEVVAEGLALGGAVVERDGGVVGGEGVVRGRSWGRVGTPVRGRRRRRGRGGEGGRRGGGRLGKE